MGDVAETQEVEVALKMGLDDFDKYEPHFWLVVPTASNIQDLLKATTANAA